MSAAPLVQEEAVALGLPGIYRLPQRRARYLPRVPMDVTGFVGLSARGPAWQPATDTGEASDWRLITPGRALRRSVPVLIESFDDYRRIFGAGTGGGMMTDAVRACFEQGARRAWIVRILPERSGTAALDPFEGCALAALGGFSGGTLALHARNPGIWGARMTARMRFRRTRLAPSDEAGLATNELAFDASTVIRAGDTLLAGSVLAHVLSVTTRARSRIPGSVRLARLSAPLPAGSAAVWLIEADLTLDDGAQQTESFRGLGLSPDHPCWIATVLARESILAWPDPAWADRTLEPELATLDAESVAAFSGGSDAANALVGPGDMFDSRWVAGDSLAERAPEGVQSLLNVPEITHLCLPDLYHPAVPPETAPLASGARHGTRFSDCELVAPVSLPQPAAVPALVIDPETEAGRAQIIALQRRVVDICEATERFIALLDAPPGLSPSRILDWRGAFASPWAAVYAPWCLAVRRDNADQTVTRIPPSAVAAGIIAASELESGIARGPANRIAREIVSLSDRPDPQIAGVLHQAGINLFGFEPDGIRLLGARTTSRELYERQLSVRRMMLRLRRLLDQELQWVVFEPSGPELWTAIEAMLDTTLREEWRLGNFAGATPESSYFIRIDRSQAALDRGELIISVGVALVEPLEFIVLRLTRSGDGTLSLESAG